MFFYIFYLCNISQFLTCFFVLFDMLIIRLLPFLLSALPVIQTEAGSGLGDHLLICDLSYIKCEHFRFLLQKKFAFVRINKKRSEFVLFAQIIYKKSLSAVWFLR